jgi:hypothetical protein
LQGEKLNDARIVQLEKSGAMMLEGKTKFQYISPAQLGPENAAPSAILLKEHLQVALLIHFRGVGKRKVAGYQP